jgi:hypothetical protein
LSSSNREKEKKEFKVVVAAAAPADERSLRISFIVYTMNMVQHLKTHVAYTPKRDGLLLKKLNKKNGNVDIFPIYLSIDASVAGSRFSFSLFGYQVAGPFFPFGRRSPFSSRWTRGELTCQ